MKENISKHYQNNKYTKVLICVILAILTTAIYWPVKNYDFVNYDDNVFITQNNKVNTGLKPENIKWAFQTMDAGNWIPVTRISFMLDSQIFGINPAGFHITNLLFHLLSTILLFWILQRMTGATWKSAVVAALFAVHPLHVESVAWVTERKDVLSMFFMLLATWAYIRYVEDPDYKKYISILILFAMGLMSKSMLVTFPFILLLLDFWPLQRMVKIGALDVAINEQPKNVIHPKTISCLIYEKIPLFVLAGISILVTIISQKEEIIIMQVIPLYSRIANALIVYIDYVIKTFWPLSLAVLYPHPEAFPYWQIIGATLLLLLISGWAIYSARRHPYFVVGWFWYLGTLVPVIGIIQVGVQSMADRYTYIPLIGLFIIIVWSMEDVLEKQVYRKYMLAGLSCIIIITLAVLTRTQLSYWKDSESLFNHALQVTENNYVMHCNMGVLQAEKGNISEAINHYEQALKIKSDDSDTNINFANLLARQGRYEEAIVHYTNAIKSNPQSSAAYNNLGIAYARIGNVDRAVEQFREAVKLHKDYPEAQNNLQYGLEQQSKLKVNIPNKKIENKEIKNVDSVAEQVQTANNLLQKADLDGAIIHFRKAINLDANNLNAHIGIGLALGYKKNFAEAIVHFHKAIEINPRIADVYNSLAVALIYSGKTNEAIVQLKKAVEINPDFAKAQNSLGVILAKTGKIDDGIAHLRQAVKIDPNYVEAKKNLDLILSMKNKK